jgi:hemolysin activation/secretion protein
MRALRRLSNALLTSLAITAISEPLSAQALPGGAAPTREEIEREGLRPTQRPVARLTVEGGIERAPCPLANPEYQNISFTLSEVVFNNLTVVPASELRGTYDEYVGKSVPIATVCEIRDRAATILRQRGYLAAVQVPPQEIEGGVVRFDVLMARVVAVQVRGDAGRSENQIAGFLRTLTEMDAFNEQEAERALLLVRDLPGYDVRLTLRPAGTTPGEVIGEVTVVYTPVEVDLNVQNYGTREVGRWGGLLRAQFNGLTGLGDRTTIAGYATADFEEQQVLSLNHDFAIGNQGLRLAGRFTHAWTEPGGEAALLEVKSRTLIATLEATYPFLRRQSENLYGAAGFDFVNQEIDLLGELANRDKLRVAFVRLDADALDRGSIARLGGYSPMQPRWRVAGSFEIRQGLGILDATEFCPGCIVQPSRVPFDATSTVFRASGFGEWRPVPAFTLAVSPRAQYSPDPLLAFEEFSAGNYTAGRGYDPGTLVGDSGFGFQSELRYGSPFPVATDAFAFQPFAFFDAAWVWNNEDGVSGSDSLYSAGGGIRTSWGDRMRLDVALAVPLKRAGLLEEKPDPRLLISFTARLLPWRR